MMENVFTEVKINVFHGGFKRKAGYGNTIFQGAGIMTHELAAGSW